eukprot:COSAG02_NODE_1360_length_13055_cov_9.008567_17_plen_54_part_00
MKADWCPARVLIIAEDVEGALELLRSRAACACVREDSWRTGPFLCQLPDKYVR